MQKNTRISAGLCALGALLGFLAVPGFAAAELAGAAPVPLAKPDIVQVSEDGCRLLAEHVPDEDVAYQPGVNVTGKQVAPADLNQPYQLRQVYQFDIEITPDRLNNKYKNTTGLAVATVTYNTETGKFLLDGQEIDRTALSAACARNQ